MLINGGKLGLVGYPSVILGPDLTGDKLRGPTGIETTLQSFVKQWIKLSGESVTAEVASSSLVVPAISFQELTESAPFSRGHKKAQNRYRK